MNESVNHVFIVIFAVLVVVGYTAFVIAEIRNSLRIERKCKRLMEGAMELWERMVDE